MKELNYDDAKWCKLVKLEIEARACEKSDAVSPLGTMQVYQDNQQCCGRGHLQGLHKALLPLKGSEE